LTNFTDLGLSPDLLQAITDAGYTTPTPIQAQAIPHVLTGRDVLGCAQTGTGKTASFSLPMIEILSSGRARARMPRSLIVEPTRELAAQVAQSFEVYGKHQKLSMALLIGGESFVEQERKLDRGVDVLIATPGRLLDLFERGKILLSDVKILVIDEADRMLDMGFIPDVERIVSLLPKIRQTLFFSATMPPEIRRLADAFLSNPKEISVAPPASPALTVTQGLAIMEPESKRDALRRLIEIEDVKNAIIFCNRKKDVDILHKSLVGHGFDAVALHGDMPQSKRTETLEKFKTNQVRLLVASDVAARGLDVQGLSHVFNFDVPIHPEDYVHRIGRTGRAGNMGRAFTLAVPEEGKAVAAIVKLIGKDIPPVTIDGVEAAELDYSDRRRGRRPTAAEPRGRKRSETAVEDESARPKSARSRPAQQDAPAPVAEQQLEAPVAPPRRDPRPPRTEKGRTERTRAERPHTEQPRRHEPIHMGEANVTPISAGRSPSLSPAPSDRRHRHDDDDERVIGFGDHLPAFLMRPRKVGGARG